MSTNQKIFMHPDEVEFIRNGISSLEAKECRSKYEDSLLNTWKFYLLNCVETAPIPKE